MPARLRVDAAVVAHAEQETLRIVAENAIAPNQLRDAGHSQLLELQSQLLMGKEWGVWEVAENLIGDHDVSRSRRVYRIERAIPPGMSPSDDRASAIWAELLRYVIARRCVPSRGKGTRGRPWFSSLHTELRALGMATRAFAERSGPGFWSRYTAEEFSRVLATRHGETLANTLRKLAAKGAIPDAPTGRKKSHGHAPPRHRTGEPEHTQAAETEEQFLPLPDAFTAAAGQRALYMTEHVGPTLLDALERCLEIPVRSENEDARSSSFGKPLKKVQKHAFRAKVLDPVIEGWAWTDADRRELSSPPFDIFFSVPRRGEFAWPPKTYSEAEACLIVLQASHLFLIALADGGRHGEILSLKVGALGRAESHAPTLTSRTRKVDPNGGRAREAPLPVAVQSAVQQQERLARFLRTAYGVKGDSLWVKPGKMRGAPLRGFGQPLGAFVRAFRLRDKLGGSNLHMHRFRKTLARLAALSLVHAPKILMDVLCHRDEQMTVMRYILADPGLLREIECLTREMLVLKGVWAIENLDKIQGKGADRLRDRWAQHARLIGVSALEPQNIRDFVETCFENGQALAVISPGILCTSFTIGGRCNQHGGGKPDPEHCSPECDHQVACPTYDNPDTYEAEDAILNALNTADYLLNELGSAEKRCEDMVAATFAGQVRSLIGRWREVDRHISMHPRGREFIPVQLVTP